MRVTLQNPLKHSGSERVNRPFPTFPGLLYQKRVKCSAFDMEMIFYSDANKTHFHKKSCALALILKVKVFGTRKWPVDKGMVRKTAHFVFLFLQGYDSIDNPKAVSALKYMLLCKIMLNRLVRIWYHQDLSQSEIRQRCF